MIRIGILTVSDRSALGERSDTSGPALAEALAQKWTEAGAGPGLAPAQVGTGLVPAQVVATGIVPDEQGAIAGWLIRASDELRLDLVLTTGGTGFALRDVTPEATRMVIQREAPGLAEAMRADSRHVTPHAMLSRAVAGIRGRTLIVNLPGSPKGAVENLLTILPVLPHAIELLNEAPDAEQHH